VRRVAALVGVFVAVQLAVCAAPTGQEIIKLNVFAPAVLPKAPIYLNATISNPTETSIYELRQTITFDRNEVRFVRARLGVAGDLAGATLSVDTLSAADAKVDDKDEATRIAIRISAKNPLPSGPLIELEFKQVQGKEQMIKLKTIAEIRDAEGKVLPGLKFHDSTVSVSKTLEPAPLKIFGCFFYMH
jgi:hypothetical protein